MFSFRIDNITLDPDPNLAKILDLDPKHWNWDLIFVVVAELALRTSSANYDQYKAGILILNSA